MRFVTENHDKRKLIGVALQAFNHCNRKDCIQQGIELGDVNFVNSIFDKVEKSNMDVIACYEGNQIIGFVGILDKKHISMFYVLPQYQRKGYGKILMNEAVKNIKSENPELKILSVHSTPFAKDVYLALGFELVSDVIKYTKGMPFYNFVLKLK